MDYGHDHGSDRSNSIYAVKNDRELWREIVETATLPRRGTLHDDE